MDVGTRKSPRRRQGAAKTPPGRVASEGPRGQAAAKSAPDQMASKSPLRKVASNSPLDEIATESPPHQMVPFRRPTSPPKKRPKLKSRGGKGRDQEEEEYFKVNFENLMEFLKLRTDPKAWELVTVDQLASPPEMWLEFYLCRVHPVEERLDAFRMTQWTRIYFLLKTPLPAFILDVEPLKKWSRLQDQVRKNNWTLGKGNASKEEYKFHQNTANNSKQALVATRIQTDRVTASRQTLKTTREKLLDLIQKVLTSYSNKGKLKRRGEQSLMEVIETGKAPDDLVYTMDPLAINLFVSRLRILQMKKKSRRGPMLVLNDFST